MEFLSQIIRFLLDFLGKFMSYSDSEVLSVNFHFLRTCNYKCGFCFHTAKTDTVLTLPKIKEGLKLLVEARLGKINFSGGEPFLKPKLLGDMVQYCKELSPKLSVTIVSNGSKITESWMNKYGKFVDILAISCDSFDYQTNQEIGRADSENRNQADVVRKVAKLCEQHGVVFKLNTVVNSKNYMEDMSETLNELSPIIKRWKVFQCLLIEGENHGQEALREAEQFCITREQFDQFVLRHKDFNPVPENNEDMKDSYYILDEKMRFLNCREGRKDPTESILDIGVEKAIADSGHDREAFKRRGGEYLWSRNDYKIPDIEDMGNLH
eukprot:m.159894 g.159894  ORF g.159894 m.159894 type:complete len:324 (+) comp15160_c0_seq1:411-1382(+)